MAYLSKRGENTLIYSHDPRIGYDVVGNFNRNWTMTEVDTFLFEVNLPTTPIESGEIYEIWADRGRQFRLGTCYVLSPGQTDLPKHPVDKFGNELFNYNVVGVGPTHFLKQRLINVVRSNVNLSDLAQFIVEKGAVSTPIQTDYSYIEFVDFTVNARFVDKTAFAILNQLRELGIGFYVDDDFYFHFFEDRQEVLPYALDDYTTYVRAMPLTEDITELRNAVKIIGKDRAKQAPDFTIEGTGDLTTGLDYTLPHNVRFDDDLLLEDWVGIEPAIWQVSDSKDSDHHLSPDGSRVILGNSAISMLGGNGVLGSNYIISTFSHERKAGNAIVQTMSFGNLGEGFILAFSDGNGGSDENLMGFYMKATGEVVIREQGVEYTLDTPVFVKRSFGESDEVLASNLSSDRKTFTVPVNVTHFFEVGDTIGLLGEGVGFHEGNITDITGNNITIDLAVPEGDFENTHVIRLAVYRFVVMENDAGFTYQVQGDGYGGLNRGVYTTVKETTVNTTRLLFVVPGSPKASECVLNIEDTFINPSGGATFVQEGKRLLVAPETEGAAFDFPVLIRAADPRRNPPLFRYRPQRFIAIIMDDQSTTTKFRVTEEDFNDMLIGERLLVNKEETFVKARLQPEENIFEIEVEPALSNEPAEGDFVYVGTTAAAEGQNGVFSYSYPVPNRRLFKVSDSIQQYGLIEDEPIIDQNLRTNEDMTNRFNAFREAKAQPRIVGVVSFELSTDLKAQED